MKTSVSKPVLPPWMVLLMEFFETLPLNPRIDLRGRDVGVSKQRLNHSQVRTTL